jgi:hypothetical protein
MYALTEHDFQNTLKNGRHKEMVYYMEENYSEGDCGQEAQH